MNWGCIEDYIVFVTCVVEMGNAATTKKGDSSESGEYQIQGCMFFLFQPLGGIEEEGKIHAIIL